METLQNYLSQNINEGEVWEKIKLKMKNWFKSLFDDDKKYSRYAKGENELSGSNLNNYKEYLKETFNKKDIVIRNLTDSELNKVVFPGGIMPSKEYNFGFYNFIDYKKDKLYKDSDYIGYMYNTKEVSDTGILVQIIYHDTSIEIVKVQIVEEFEQLLTIKDMLEMFIKNKEIIKNYKNIIIKEKVNKDLFNQVINDCNFTKEFEDGQSIAKFTLNKKSDNKK